MKLLVFSHSFLLFFYCRSASPKDWVESARMSPSFAPPEISSVRRRLAAETGHGGDLFSVAVRSRCTEPNFFSSACLRALADTGVSSSTLSEKSFDAKLRVAGATWHSSANPLEQLHHRDD